MMNFLKRYRKELFTNKKINVTKKTHEFKTDFIFRQNDNLNKNRSIFKDYFNSNTFKYKEKLLLKIIVLVFILSIEISCNLHYVFAEGTANKETVIKSSEYYELKYRDITTSHYEVTVSDAVFSQIELMKMFHITSVKDSLSRIEENLNSLPNNFKDELINRTGLLIRYKDSHFQVLDMTREISAVKTQNVKVKNYSGCDVVSSEIIFGIDNENISCNIYVKIPKVVSIEKKPVDNKVTVVERTTTNTIIITSKQGEDYLPTNKANSGTFKNTEQIKISTIYKSDIANLNNITIFSKTSGKIPLPSFLIEYFWKHNYVATGTMGIFLLVYGFIILVPTIALLLQYKRDEHKFILSKVQKSKDE